MLGGRNLHFAGQSDESKGEKTAGGSVEGRKNLWMASARAAEPGFQPRKQCVRVMVLPRAVVHPFPCFYNPSALFARGRYKEMPEVSKA